MLLLDRRGARPGSRPRVWVTYKLQTVVKMSRFFCGYSATTGRNNSGIKTVRTKSSSTVKPKFWPTFPISRGVFSLSLVVFCRIRSLFSATLFLLRSAVGAWYCVPATTATQLYSYTRAASICALRVSSPDFGYTQQHWWRQLIAVAPYGLVSQLAQQPGAPAQFARALGSTCRVLIPEVTIGWALISLPSKRLLFVNNLVYVVQGALAPVNLCRLAITNAGLNKRRGVASIVRGTVRNPNDHPHGGRTRAIKYPRTPWGRTTKNPRQPRPVPKFKALNKRKVRPVKHYIPYWKATELVSEDLPVSAQTHEFDLAEEVDS